MAASSITSSALDRAVCLLREAEIPFWIAGGIAIDLFVGRQTRPHQDIDIQIIRGTDRKLASHLRGWDLQVAHEGTLGPWTPDHHRNGIWCRESSDAPWAFELLLADVVDERWIYRRDRRITRPLADIEMVTDASADRELAIPFLRPEIQLLFKSKNVRPNDEADFHSALPLMDQDARRWLRDSLASIDREHPWLAWL